MYHAHVCLCRSVVFLMLSTHASISLSRLYFHPRTCAFNNHCRRRGTYLSLNTALKAPFSRTRISANHVLKRSISVSPTLCWMAVFGYKELVCKHCDIVDWFLDSNAVNEEETCKLCSNLEGRRRLYWLWKNFPLLLLSVHLLPPFCP